jgi:hypothetical protein
MASVLSWCSDFAGFSVSHAALIRVVVVGAAGADRGGYLRAGKPELAESATPATTNHNSFNGAESGEGAESSEARVWE